ncbi:hypothetical protein [Thiocapsa sp.]|uniref:hypothetical protein n=1 Tax=Thiocapsa sp. TaxID=2024551 RepID=UPI002B876AEE|nr:hypothetical protein [Thiocapsa sp.]HSO81823.1 hypothetical protein [Thiocapsa sp.]
MSPDQIAALDDEGLRLLIARLCEADLRRRRLATSAVLYGGNQIAADGGIDVRIELPADTPIDGFIPRPATGFQAKADDMPASEIVKEMRREVTQPDGTKTRRLRPSVRALAAERGAYVIVSSKGSTADSRLTERRDAMRAAVADLPGSDALHLDFYDWTRMATLGALLSRRRALGLGPDRPRASQLAARLRAKGSRAVLMLARRHRGSTAGLGGADGGRQ